MSPRRATTTHLGGNAGDRVRAQRPGGGGLQRRVLPYAQGRTFLSPTIETTHSGMRSNTRVVDDLFAAHVAVLTAPPAAARVGPTTTRSPPPAGLRR